MVKLGLLVLLGNIILKLIVGFGLWRMAMNYRDESNNPINEDISPQPQYYVEEPNDKI